nr:unnamed protein product [Callosobruchus chinensis]
MMYRMLCGVEGHLRKELFLDNLSGNENNQFMTYLQKHEDKQRAQMEFSKVCSSMNVLGISQSEQKVIFSVLAAIFHLGCAGVVKGFQNPATCGRQVGASFEDLCHNYLQERLQLLFHHTNLVAPRDRYLQENIDIVYDENENETLINPTPLVNLLDKQAQNTVIRTSQMDLHEADRRGLLWLLDEEAIYPGSSDESFIERLFTHYGDRDHQLLIRKAPGNNQFIIQHLQGTNPVLYSAKGWLRYSRENPVSRTAITILQESSKRTKLRFIQCLLPQHNAGLCEANAPLIAAKASGQNEDSLINVPLLRSQIRGAQILDAVRLYKQGFPNFMPLGEFRRRFHLLAGDYKVSSPVLDERKAVEDMLLALDLEPSSYRVGLSQDPEIEKFRRIYKFLESKKQKSNPLQKNSEYWTSNYLKIDNWIYCPNHPTCSKIKRVLIVKIYIYP